MAMMKRIAKVALPALLTASVLAGCTEAEVQTANLSRQADNFEKTRIVTVINTRTDRVIFRLTGTFSCQYSNGDLDIITATGPNEYEKHFVHLNEWLTYIVEDTEGTGDLWYQKIEYFPEPELVIETDAPGQDGQDAPADGEVAEQADDGHGE